MARLNEAVEMTYDMLTLVFICAELHLPFSKYGFGGNNAVLLIEDQEQYHLLLNGLRQNKNCRILNSPKIGKLNLPNYILALYPLNRYDAPDNILEFLRYEGTFTAVIAYGILPQYLLNLDNLILLRIPVGVKSEIYFSQLESVKLFLRDNPVRMQTCLEEFCTTANYIGHKSDSELHIRMYLAVSVYKLWYRSCHTETETEQEINRLLQNLQYVLENSISYGDMADIGDAFIRLFLAHTEQQKTVFCPAEKVEGRPLELMKTDEVIFYDNTYYYVPETLFKKICAPMLKSLGYMAVKKGLLDAEILECGKDGQVNYTRKKLLCTAYGIEIRKRFNWLLKNKFLQVGQLAPEERTGI